GRGVDRVVGRIAANGESIPGKRFGRWKDEKLIPDRPRTGRPEAQLEIGVAGTRPDSILEVEAGAVGGLSETEQLEIGVGIAGDGLFLIFAAAGDDFQSDTLPAQVRSAESVDASDLAIELGVTRLDVGIPHQIRQLIAVLDEFEIRGAAGRGVDRIAPVDTYSVSDDQPLAVQRERTNERDPEQRGIRVIVDAFAE